MLLLLEWVALGVIVGLIPLQRVQWSTRAGLIAGVIGAVLGGWLYSGIANPAATYFNLGSIGAAMAGAVVVLVVYGYTAAFQD
jgi:uncharacterized membrane protein YeaQ/YmgE (transglycosylase-associated protein family)